MDSSASLISKIVQNPAAITEAIDLGVKPDLFISDGGIWEWCIQYFKDFGSAPSAEALLTEYPEFSDRLVPATEPTGYFVSELRKQYAFGQLLKISREIAVGLKQHDDPFSILETEVRSRVLNIDDLTSESQDTDWASSEGKDSRLRRYDYIKANQGKVGIITPFPSLNATFQLRYEGLYIIVARQGVGKTWLLALLARHAWLTEKRPVVFDSCEMPIEQIEARLDSLTYGVASDSLVRGDLNTVDEVRWKKGLEDSASTDTPFHLIEESSGVSAIAAKLEKYNAGSIWIDGAYMVQDERGGGSDWQSITNVCRDLKRLAKRTKTVICITLQFNRKASNTDGAAEHIALGDVAKEADGILGLFRSEDQKMVNRATLKVLKNRHSLESAPIELDWDLDRGSITEADRVVDMGEDRPAPTRAAPSLYGDEDIDY
jgi:replicative DNA helicase